MPVFKKDLKEAQDFNIVPGNWLVKVPKFVKMGETSKPGIEIGASAKKHEMWKCLLEVVDDSLDAPKGTHFYDNLTWDGDKGEGRILALLRHLGHPVDEWRKSPTPVDINPDHLYERPFVMRLRVRYYENENKTTKAMEWRKTLEGDGFMPYQPASAPRGKLADTTAAPTAPPQKKGAKGAAPAGGDASFGFGANAGGAPASGKPDDAFGWGG